MIAQQGQSKCECRQPKLSALPLALAGLAVGQNGLAPATEGCGEGPSAQGGGSGRDAQPAFGMSCLGDLPAL